MDAFYDKRDKKAFSRESIIGLGEESFRKNYYPELQEKILNLEQINARNKALIATIPDLLFVSNIEGDIVPFSFGEQKDSVVKREILYNMEIVDILLEGVQIAKATGTLHTKEFQMNRENGIVYYEARFQKSENDEILIMVRDMTERILLENQLRYLAEKDSLTNIYNRRSFEITMGQYNGKEKENLTLISMDINGLKFINDTLGHLEGDRIIVDAVDIIRKVFEESGHVARIGGDEFGIILESFEEGHVEMMLGRMNQRVNQYNTTAEKCVLSISYGYSFHREGIVNMEFMYQEADNNMYQNKLLKKESIHSTFVKTFMSALEARDYILEGHVARMEKLAVMIGETLMLHQDQMDRLVLLTKFHDIGKIGIPDDILKKPAKLNVDEWKIMRTHTTIGERIALEAAELKDIAHLILKHHERWDGNGYPLGLAGEEIPIECRILAIVDTYDAMTNDRPYRQGCTKEEAEEEIVNCTGTQFDPLLVEVFKLVINEFLD